VDPDQQLPRLVALWDQIASHYKDFPDTLFFELVNEPQGNLTDDKWQTIFPELLRTVRKTNPDRMVIIGPGYWNSLDHLNALHLPNDDRRLIVTFHYYIPLRFTHQGAAWVYGANQWKGTTWTGTPEERQVLRDDLDKAAAWADEKRRPLYLGEFGSYSAADMASRARWAGAVVVEAERHEMSWAYFDFCSSTFGAYDQKTKSWREPMLRALIPKTP
jgi:endoglucanase